MTLADAASGVDKPAALAATPIWQQYVRTAQELKQQQVLAEYNYSWDKPAVELRRVRQDQLAVKPAVPLTRLYQISAIPSARAQAQRQWDQQGGAVASAPAAKPAEAGSATPTSVNESTVEMSSLDGAPVAAQVATEAAAPAAPAVSASVVPPAPAAPVASSPESRASARSGAVSQDNAATHMLSPTSAEATSLAAAATVAAAPLAAAASHTQAQTTAAPEAKAPATAAALFRARAVTEEASAAPRNNSKRGLWLVVGICLAVALIAIIGITSVLKGGSSDKPAVAASSSAPAASKPAASAKEEPAPKESSEPAQTPKPEVKVPIPVGAEILSAAGGYSTPTGNISCLADPASTDESSKGSVTCRIFRTQWAQTPGQNSCSGSYYFTLAGGDVSVSCSGPQALDAQPAPFDAATPRGYGFVFAAGDVFCASASNGFTCTNSVTGHNYFLSIQNFTVA